MLVRTFFGPVAAVALFVMAGCGARAAAPVTSAANTQPPAPAAAPEETLAGDPGEMEVSFTPAKRTRGRDCANDAMRPSLSTRGSTQHLVGVRTPGAVDGKAP